MIVGSMVSSTVSGSLITRWGKWKVFLVVGSICMLAGFALLGTIDHNTNMVLLGAFLLVLGIGMGMTMQNLVLAVQNTVAPTDLGTASSTVAFFRSLGGSIGVSVLGAVLATRVSDLTLSGLTAAGVPLPAGGGSGSAEIGISNLNQLPGPIADVVRGAYGDATALIFLISAALSIITVLAVLVIREVPLRTQNAMQQQAQPEKADATAES